MLYICAYVCTGYDGFSLSSQADVVRVVWIPLEFLRTALPLCCLDNLINLVNNFFWLSLLRMVCWHY